MRHFESFACFDWSGQAVARPKGIALAIARAGADAPALVASPAGKNANWSREEALGWLMQQAHDQSDILIGCDFSFALPHADKGGYFSDWTDNPDDAQNLWTAIDDLCCDEPHLTANTVIEHPELRRHFRRQADGSTVTGDRFIGTMGRLRITEIECRRQKHGNAVSCFNLVGPAQVGKSSLTGMRVLNLLAGAIPVWPFDPIPESGPMLVEIYTGLAARDAGLSGSTKIRDAQTLDAALGRLSSQLHRPLQDYDDHSTDAILTAAWLRQAATDNALWEPASLTEKIRRTEGWTFGVA